MAKIISRNFLKTNLTGQKLNAQVGVIRIGGKNLRGVGLKKFALTNLGGKTHTRIEKMLKGKYGVSGYQQEKREKLMRLIRGEGQGGLSKEQVKKNLEITKERDEPDLNRQVHKTQFIGGETTTKSFGPMAEKGTMERLGVRRGETGFAANANKNKAAEKPETNASAGGVRPIGL